MDIVLYHKRYTGKKVTFNSRKGQGLTIEGIAVEHLPQLNVVILRDTENFSHAVDINSLKQI